MGTVNEDEFLDLYQRGYSRAAIARHFQISPDSAGRMRRKLGLPRWGQQFYQRAPKYSRSELMAAVSQSNSVQEVMDKLGCAKSTVCDFMRQNNIPTYPPRRNRKVDRDSVRHLAQSGLTAVQIAKRLDANPDTIRSIMRKVGVAPPAKNRPLSEEIKAKALEMLEDGASYPETARTLGCGASVLRRRFPGYQWTAQESGRFAMLMRYDAMTDLKITHVPGRKDER